MGSQDALERVLHVVGGHFAAVVELHALAEVEHVGRVVGMSHDSARSGTTAQIVVEPDEAVVHEVDAAHRGERGHDMGIEADRFLVHAYREHLLAGLRRMRRRRRRSSSPRGRRA